MSFQMEITKALNKLSDLIAKKNPDADVKNSPHGSLVGTAYFWTKVENYAKAKKEEAWEALEKSGVSSDTWKDAAAGTYMMLDSPSFTVQVKVSNPIKRFNAGYLGEQLLRSKYKVPLPVTRELVDAAKLETKGSVTKIIIEK